MSPKMQEILTALHEHANDDSSEFKNKARRMLAAHYGSGAKAQARLPPGVSAAVDAEMSRAMGCAPEQTRQVYREGNSLVLGGLKPVVN